VISDEHVLQRSCGSMDFATGCHAQTRCAQLRNKGMRMGTTLIMTSSALQFVDAGVAVGQLCGAFVGMHW
jgi:hypothetical protein